MSAYIKDFTSWFKRKVQIDALDDIKIPYFNEREIWYCSMGCNVGFEQDGKGTDFWRPVIIIKKYNKHLFTGIPLTSKTKKGPFYFNIGEVDNRLATAILSQTKSYSSKRLINKLGTLDVTIYKEMKKVTSEYLFNDLIP